MNFYFILQQKKTKRSKLVGKRIIGSIELSFELLPSLIQKLLNIRLRLFTFHTLAGILLTNISDGLIALAKMVKDQAFSAHFVRHSTRYPCRDILILGVFVNKVFE